MKLFRKCLILVFLAVMAFSGWKLASELLDLKHSAAVSEEIAEMVVRAAPAAEAGKALPPTAGAAQNEKTPSLPGSPGETERKDGTEPDGAFAPEASEQLPRPKKDADTGAEPETSEGRQEAPRPAEPSEDPENIGTPLGTEGKPPIPGQAPISVDFETLLARCPDAVGWLYCPEINVNYPVMQSSEDSFYLNHLPDRQYGASGALFVDAEASPDFSDRNTVIHGHNMKDGTMFGCLQRFAWRTYWDPVPRIYLLTPQASFRVDVFAAFVDRPDAVVYERIRDDADMLRLIDYARSSALFAAPTVPEADDNLLTLSTCSYEFDDARFVVLAILRELAG